MQTGNIGGKNQRKEIILEYNVAQVHLKQLESNTTRRNERALFTVNIYRATSSLLVNGQQMQKFIYEILPAIQTRG